MQINLRYEETRVRRPNSQQYEGEEKFYGSKTYAVVGTLNHERVRFSLGTTEKNVAIRRITKIEKAVGEGPASGLWDELVEALPARTFQFFASRIGYVAHQESIKVSAPTWQDLVDAYEIEMQRKVDNEERGASRKEGTLATSSRDRYRVVIRDFTNFIGKDMPLAEITPAHITRYKSVRHRAIVSKKQSRGGNGVRLDIAFLHAMFKFAVARKMMAEQPIDLSKESRPGENPTNGARPFTGDELAVIRSVTVDKNGRGQEIDDTHMFLLFRWTGLRRSDAADLRWKHVLFGQGYNGEIEIVTKKRDKLAIIPLSTELRDDLETIRRQRKPHREDHVLLNPETGRPFTDPSKLTKRATALCARARIKAGPHYFRSSFACDMLARGVGIYEVAMMLADTVETVQRKYAKFVPAAREAVRIKMDQGVGIEEQAKIAAQRGRKVVGIRG